MPRAEVNAATSCKRPPPPPPHHVGPPGGGARAWCARARPPGQRQQAPVTPESRSLPGRTTRQGLCHPRFVAPQGDGVDHRIAPGPLRDFLEPRGAKHVLVKGRTCEAAELLSDRRPHLLGVVMDAHRRMRDQRRHRATGAVSSPVQGWERDVAQVRARAHPANGPIGLGAT